MNDKTELDLSVFDEAAGCLDHPSQQPRDEIVAVLVSRQWCYCEIGGGSPCESYCDTSGAAVYKMLNGGFMVACESSDTSGHG